LTVVSVTLAVGAILAADVRLHDSTEEDAWLGPDAAAIAQERAAIAAQQKWVADRIELKGKYVRELIDGRLSLAQVTAEFVRLNEEYPAARDHVRFRYAGSSDEEKTARNVLDHVRPRVADEQRDAVLARLEREFVALYGCPVG
jgi:hypothetical protein